ncbi:phage portal protein [Martelella mangrovi]|uniref:HK97 family phage portal protein n=1 Tax=Martelella mangrovi TaxID=1397477 RepID=A0ABV2IIJ9_9HYPH
MRLFSRKPGREVRAANIEDPKVKVSASNFLEFFGIKSGNLPSVTIENAMRVPAFSAAVSFLSGSLANLPLHAFKTGKDGASQIKGGVQTLLNEAPNPQWTSYSWREYCWSQVFTSGRSLSWIERAGRSVVAIWPMEPGKVTIRRTGGRVSYSYEGKTYDAQDVIDIAFLRKSDMISSYAPVATGRNAIQLALAMNEYGSNFFANGGIPPLALTGPMPTGANAMKRAKDDIDRAIDYAREFGDSFFSIPPGYELKQVGFDPAKGQMTEARRFQIEEIARLFNLPPLFLQDLIHATLNNSEQQDLHLVKHVIAQWARNFEQEINLKLFGQMRNSRYAEHNLDALMRGDFKSRIEGLARGVQSGILTPNEAREKENRPNKPNGDTLYIQGATVPLGTVSPSSAPVSGEPTTGE